MLTVDAKADKTVIASGGTCMRGYYRIPRCSAKDIWAVLIRDHGAPATGHKAGMQYVEGYWIARVYPQVVKDVILPDDC